MATDEENQKVIDEALRLHRSKVGGRVGVRGTFEFRDKDGNVVGTMTGEGSVPFSDLEKPKE